MRHLIAVLLLTALLAPAHGQDGFHPRLLQVRLSAAAVPAGGSLGVTWWWQNVGTVPDPVDERVFVHVRRAGEAETAPDGVRLGADHDPLVPTHRWRPGRVISYLAPVPIPASTPPGDYVLLAGMYGEAGRRTLELPLAPGEDDRRYLLARFRVLPAGQAAEAAPPAQTFFPVPPQAQAAPPAPAETVTVGTGPLTLVLDARAPRPVAWRLGGAELAGDPQGDEPDVHVLSTADYRVIAADVAPYTLAWRPECSRDRAVYHGIVSRGGRPAVTFDLVYRVDGPRAEVALERVVEQPGYELVRVRPGRLVSARRAARLALPFQSGRLIDPVGDVPTERDFGLNWYYPVLAGVVHDDRLLCAASLPGVDDRFVAALGESWAAVGASFEHRALTQPPVPSLRLSDRASVTLRFASPTGRAPDWMDGARLLRAEVTAKPPASYDQTLIYKIFCDSPGSKGFTTFDQALELVRRYGNLVDHAPQIAYLVGWQHHGHDTGYPDVFTVNERLGGYDGLVRVMGKAAEYNAVLSFHDNYDDAYEASPAWNPDLIARDPAGKLMKGGVWAGGQSYILSFRKYGLGPGRERVDRTLDRYPIRVSYHIDVLSAVPVRHDYNPTSPTSGAGSLEGKLAIVREFNRRGVDVTSEGFTAPFIGVIGHAWHLQRGRDTVFAGEQRIPFIPFVYHGHATYGGAKATTPDIPDALIYGATFSTDFGGNTPARDLGNFYYLLTVPYLQLRRREVTDYHAAGTTRRTSFGPDSYVEVDDSGPHYQVVVDGRLIARDYTSFALNTKGDAWLAYARDGGPLDYPAPQGWTKAQGVTLTFDGPGVPVPVTIKDGRIRLDAPAGVPVRVTGP